MEHYIHLVKLLTRKLGPNQTNRNILQRYLKALGFTKPLLEDFDDDDIRRRLLHDKAKIVEELKSSKALVPQLLAVRN